MSTFVTERVIPFRPFRGINATMHISCQINSNFLAQPRWRLYKIRQPLTCLCTTSNFLTNTPIETFQAGHLGRPLATISRGKYQRQVRQGRDERQDRRDGRDRQDTKEKHDLHLNLTFVFSPILSKGRLNLWVKYYESKETD